MIAVNASTSRVHSMERTGVLSPVEAGRCVALNREAGTTTAGDTVEEAIVHLKMASEFFG